MNSLARRSFWAAFERLPAHVQDIARRKFRIWQSDPFHPSLHFKLIKDDLWSVRVTEDYRALGLRSGESIVWFWIGTHAEYDRLLS